MPQKKSTEERLIDAAFALNKRSIDAALGQTNVIKLKKCSQSLFASTQHWICSIPSSIHFNVERILCSQVLEEFLRCLSVLKIFKFFILLKILTILLKNRSSIGYLSRENCGHFTISVLKILIFKICCNLLTHWNLQHNCYLIVFQRGTSFKYGKFLFI